MSQSSPWVTDYYCLPLAKSAMGGGHAGMEKINSYRGIREILQFSKKNCVFGRVVNRCIKVTRLIECTITSFIIYMHINVHLLIILATKK